MQAELRGAFPGPKLSIGPKGEQGAGELCLWGEEWPGDPAACGEAGAGEPLPPVPDLSLPPGDPEHQLPGGQVESPAVPGALQPGHWAAPPVPRGPVRGRKAAQGGVQGAGYGGASGGRRGVRPVLPGGGVLQHGPVPGVPDSGEGVLVQGQSDQV